MFVFQHLIHISIYISTLIPECIYSIHISYVYKLIFSFPLYKLSNPPSPLLSSSVQTQWSLVIGSFCQCGMQLGRYVARRPRMEMKPMKATGSNRTQQSSNTNRGENLVILSFLWLIQFRYFVGLGSIIVNLSYQTGGIQTDPSMEPLGMPVTICTRLIRVGRPAQWVPE